MENEGIFDNDVVSWVVEETLIKNKIDQQKKARTPKKSIRLNILIVLASTL